MLRDGLPSWGSPPFLMTTDHSFLLIHVGMNDAALRTLPRGRAAPLQEWVNHSPVHWMKELVACDALCLAERMKYWMMGPLVVPFFKKVGGLQTTKKAGCLWTNCSEISL